MKIGYTYGVVTVFLLGTTILLTACSNGHQSASPVSSNMDTQVASPAPGSNDTTGSNTNPDISSDTSTNPSANSGTSLPPSHQLSTLFSQIRDQAVAGGVINCPYLAGTTMIDQVKKEWGTPDQENVAGEGIYATYSAKEISIGFNKGGQIFDVRNYSSAVKGITLSRLKAELGQPNQVNHLQGQDILIYNVSDKFQLQFAIPVPTQPSPDLHVDHYNVVWPKGAGNLMTQP